MKQNEPNDSAPIEFNLRDKITQLSADILRVMGPLVKRFDDLLTTDRILREGREERGSGERATRKYAKSQTRPKIAGARKGSYRDAVLDIMRESAAPLTLSDITERLGARGITPASRGSLTGMLSSFVKLGKAHWDRPSTEERRLGIESAWRIAPGASPQIPPAEPPAIATVATNGAPLSIHQIAMKALGAIGQPATKADIMQWIVTSGVPVPGGSNSPVHMRIGWALKSATEHKTLIKKGLGADATYRLK